MNSLYIAKNNTILVTNLNDWRDIDILWQLTDKIKVNDICYFDMRNIKSLFPQSVIMLYTLCSKIKEKSGFMVFLTNLSDNVNGYLHRINFLNDKVCPLGNYFDYKKNPNSKNLLEFTKVSSLEQINQLGDWFYNNFEHWFPNKAQSTYRQFAFEAINELCSNSVEHSCIDHNGEAYFTLQKYLDSHGKTNVVISVGDYGIGVRRHLTKNFPDLMKTTDAAILLQAVSGKSGRINGKGGRGLKSICNITKEYGGYFVIRSGRGLVFIQNGNIYAELHSYLIPGTQCAFCLRVDS